MTLSLFTPVLEGERCRCPRVLPDRSDHLDAVRQIALEQPARTGLEWLVVALEQAIESSRADGLPIALSDMAVSGGNAYGTLVGFQGDGAWGAAESWDVAQRSKELAARSSALDAPATTELAKTLVENAKDLALYLASPSEVRKESALYSRWLHGVPDVDPPWRPLNCDAWPRQLKCDDWVGNLLGPTRLRVVHARPDGETRATIVLCHGHASESAEYYDFAKDLLKLGFAVVAPDLLCCGYSDMKAEMFAGDGDVGLKLYDELLLDIAGRYAVPHKPVVLAGGSLGGNMALRAAAQASPRFSAFIAWSPGSAWRITGEKMATGALRSRKEAKGLDPFNFPALRKGHFFRMLEGTEWYSFVMGKSQLHRWYSPGWSCIDCSGRGAIEFRQEIYNETYRALSWQVAAEQLEYSFHQQLTELAACAVPILLAAGADDDQDPEFLYSGTAALGSALGPLRDVSKILGWAPFANTGHSIHNERPVALAALIKRFLEAAHVI